MSDQYVELQVDGMDCANCAAGITRYLERKGLADVQVNFQTGEVRYRLVPDSLSAAEVKQGIHKLGYSVVEPEESEPWWTLERKLLVSALFTLPLLLHHLLMVLGSGIPGLHNPWIQMGVCLVPFAIGFLHFGSSALRSLRAGVPNMDVLIFMGSTAAFGYSLTGTFLAEADYIFYETAATIITLVLVGNWLEKRAVAQTTTAIKELSDLQVETARRIMPSGTVVSIPLEELRIGDMLQVNEGDKVPADGRIQQGTVTVDESMLTGESEPVPKTVGDTVIGASVVQSGHLQMEVERLGRDSVLGQMIELVKTAQQDKPALQRLADRISAIFVPVVLGIAALTFGLGHWAFGLSSQQALMNAIAVLVISCPCAMGLATPTAVMVGVGRLARNGILVKGGQTVETLASIKNMVFDKTGTLTTGSFSVADIEYLNADPKKIHALIYEMEKHSSHPIAKSLVAALSDRVNGYALDLRDIREEKGVGMLATGTDGKQYRLGSARVLAKADTGNDLYLTENDRPLARLRLSDALRTDAADTITHLKAMDVHPIILSGDRQEKTERLAARVGIADYHAEQLPDQKLAHISRLSEEAPTAMVGDGINDAPALARATVGISLGQASQAAIQSAQIILLKDQLAKLPQAMAIARHTLLTIKQNLFWAFAYNIVAIPIAALGFLNPMWGALFMAVSDVLVIGNSIRLKHKKINIP